MDEAYPMANLSVDAVQPEVFDRWLAQRDEKRDRERGTANESDIRKLLLLILWNQTAPNQRGNLVRRADITGAERAWLEEGWASSQRS